VHQIQACSSRLKLSVETYTRQSESITAFANAGPPAWPSLNTSTRVGALGQWIFDGAESPARFGVVGAPQVHCIHRHIPIPLRCRWHWKQTKQIFYLRLKRAENLNFEAKSPDRFWNLNWVSRIVTWEICSVLRTRRKEDQSENEDGRPKLEIHFCKISKQRIPRRCDVRSSRTEVELTESGLWLSWDPKLTVLYILIQP
jgi:hypothetical protein